MTETETAIDSCNFFINSLQDIKRRNADNLNLTLGIVVGLIFGLVGNLAVTLLYELGIKKFPQIYQALLLVILSAIILFLIWLHSYQDKRTRQLNLEFNQRINELLALQDMLKRYPDKIRHPDMEVWKIISKLK